MTGAAKRTIAAAMSTTAVAWAVSIAAVSGQAAPTDRPPMAEDVFKNIQVLKGIPVDQFMGTMGFFSASLGLNCTDCHSDESGGNWEKYADDTPLKRMARRMITMMQAINSDNFGGRQMVTCNTCHRGTTNPNVMPSLTQLYGTPPPDEPGDPIVQAPGQPSADSILDKYIAAVGGAQKAGTFTSFTATGTYRGYDDSEETPLEVYSNSNGQRAIVVHALSGLTTTTYDGRNGWMAAPATDKPFPLIAITGQELEGVKLEAQVFFPSQIKQALRNWRAGFKTEIGDREVQVIQGVTAGGGVATLCFDVETGLLVRLTRYDASPVGRIVTRVDYTDYRDAGGIKMPFKWTVSWLDGRSVYALSRVQPNVAIDPAKFANNVYRLPSTVYRRPTTVPTHDGRRSTVVPSLFYREYRGAAMTITRREAMSISGSALAALSLGALTREDLEAQAPQAQAPWPDQLVERPLRDGFPAPLPLNPDGSAPEHPASEAGPITTPLMWRTPDRQAPQIEFDYQKMQIKVDTRGLARRVGTMHFSDLERLPRVSHTFLLQCGAPNPRGVVKWTGVRFADFADMLGLIPGAHYCRFVASDRNYVDEDVATLRHPQVMLAWLMNDEPIPPKHGAPLRLIVPFRYGNRSIKAITEMMFATPGLPMPPLPA